MEQNQSSARLRWSRSHVLLKPPSGATFPNRQVREFWWHHDGLTKHVAWPPTAEEKQRLRLAGDAVMEQDLLSGYPPPSPPGPQPREAEEGRGLVAHPLLHQHCSSSRFILISQTKEGALGLDNGAFVLAWPASSDKSEPGANNSFPISGPTKNKLGRETPMRTKHM